MRRINFKKNFEQLRKANGLTQEKIAEKIGVSRQTVTNWKSGRNLKERDLYNYQKSIAEKTKEKTSLERQIDVLDGDDSEASKSKIQKLRLELESVTSDIEELEYEKQRADTESMLNAIKDDMMEWQNKRMDDEAGLLEGIRGEVETKSDEIMSTLKEIATEYGTTLSTSLTTIFGSEKPFDNVVTAINNLIAEISGVVGADSNVGNASSGTGSVADIKPNTEVKQPTTPVANTKQPIDTQSKAEADNIFIPQKSVYPKDKLNKDKSVTDRCKYFDFASDFQSRAIYYSKLGGSGTYRGTSSQNTWLINKMKEVGYARGTSYARGGLRWTQEDGKEEIIIRASDGAILTPLNVGDKVVNAEGTSNLYDFANNPQEFLARMGLNYSMPAMNIPTMSNITTLINKPSNTPQVHDINMTFELPNVKSADDFINELQHSSRFEKIVQSMTLGNSLGGNSLNKYRY